MNEEQSCQQYNKLSMICPKAHHHICPADIKADKNTKYECVLCRKGKKLRLS